MRSKVSVKKIKGIVQKMNEILKNDVELEKLRSAHSCCSCELGCNELGLVYCEFEDQIKEHEIPLYQMIMEIYEEQRNLDFVLSVLGESTYNGMKNTLDELMRNNKSLETESCSIYTSFVDCVYFLRNPEFRDTLKNLFDKVFASVATCKVYMKGCYHEWLSEYCDYNYIFLQKKIFGKIVRYDMGKFAGCLNLENQHEGRQDIDEVVSEIEAKNDEMQDKYFNSLKNSLVRICNVKKMCLSSEFRKFIVENISTESFKSIVCLDEDFQNYANWIAEVLLDKCEFYYDNKKKGRKKVG